MAAWFSRSAGNTLRVQIYTQPGASKTEIAGLHDGALKIRVAAPALEDRANQELTRFLAELFSVPKRNVTLLRGHKSRSKQFEVTGSGLDPANIPVEEH